MPGEDSRGRDSRSTCLNSPSGLIESTTPHASFRVLPALLHCTALSVCPRLNCHSPAKLRVVQSLGSSCRNWFRSRPLDQCTRLMQGDRKYAGAAAVVSFVRASCVTNCYSTCSVSCQRQKTTVFPKMNRSKVQLPIL